MGEGDFALYLKECKGYWNKITFTGKLAKSELNKFYQIADIGILLSLHEQCSYVVLEMLSYGIPIIGSDSTGLKEMIENKNQLIKYRYKKEKAYCSIKRIADTIHQTMQQKEKIILPPKYTTSIVNKQIKNLILNCGTEKHIE